MSLLKIGRKGERSNETPTNDEKIGPLNSDQLGISAEAAQHIKHLSAQKEIRPVALRVSVRGGGCSGFSIHYEFTETIKDSDLRFKADDVQVIIDRKSLGVLGGATLHCRDYLGSKSFILVNNPNAKQCSCGQSFSL
jgi:iron-sulfur cluster assembly accessory protein